MSDGPTTDESPYGPNAYSLLQQQLVAVRGRLDRQVSRLIRLNRVSDELLDRGSSLEIAPSFAEGIVDVLDVAVGAVWILPTDDDGEVHFASFGAPIDRDGWQALGPSIAADLTSRGARGAEPLAPSAAAGVGPPEMVDALVSTCVGRSGSPSALVLAANTHAMAGMMEPSGEDTVEILTLLAEKLAAHLDNAADRRTIDVQVRRLRDSEERMELVLQGTNDGWWDWEFDTNSCFVSARWRQMLGHHAAEGTVLERFWTDRVHPVDRPGFDRLLEDALVHEDHGFETEIRMRRADGTYLPVLVRGTISRDADGVATRFTGSILDLTERHRQERQVRRLAFFDPLTDLPNRRLLLERLEQALRSNERNDRTAAVLMLDLDRFKTLNDTHGHAAGDQLLRSAGQRLRSVVRSSDTVARLSGDEFIVLLADAGPDVATATAAAGHVAANIQAAMAEPFEIDAGQIHHSASIGIAVAAESGLTVDAVLKRADVAMYEAKASGRNAVSLFQPEMEHRVAERSALEADLRRGFADGELEIYYQPQVDVAGRLFGAEALMRWFPVDAPPVSPLEFLTVAEESGFIHELGAWALETACERLASWSLTAPPGFRVAVNLASSEFLHPEFPERVLSVLDRTGVDGELLRLEITEATVVTDLAFAASRMEELRSHGIEFALDDFGTGYSSLTYLRRLPVAEVKIDQSYIRDFPSNTQDVAIVDAVLTLCSSLGLRVVAEGVETEAQWRALDDFGCEYFQGYLFGRPVAAPDDVAELVEPAFRQVT
jgi:diguanylate cyclase (GGDEF)-like protein/PAS domain S-box-containing protein